jgi:uncharacterized repeat protein (TIGR04138 family)
MSDIKSLKKIVNQDSRYPVDAYAFVLEALHYTRKRFGIQGHVTGQQLCEGIKCLALERYGAMTKMVLEHWGISKTIDFGNIVINMVNEKVLSKTPEDKLKDFEDVYDFDDVFVRDYQLKLRPKTTKLRRRK